MKIDCPVTGMSATGSVTIRGKAPKPPGPDVARSERADNPSVVSNVAATLPDANDSMLAYLRLTGSCACCHQHRRQ